MPVYFLQEDITGGRGPGLAVPASRLGLTSDQWDASLELEAFLRLPFELKDVLEHKGYLTGTQSMQLMHTLMTKHCSDIKPLKHVMVFAQTSTARR